MPVKRGKRWVARVQFEGRQVHLGTFDRKSEAREREDEERRLRRKVRGRETCDSFAERWTTDYPRPKRSTNLHNHERVFAFGVDFKGVPLTDVDRPTARQWAIRNPGRASAVRALFSDALNDGLVEANPFLGLRLPQSRGRRDIVALTEPEIEHLAACAPYPEFGAAVMFAAYVGVRVGELIELRWPDLEGQRVHVSRQRTVHGEVTPPKSGQARIVVLPPPASGALSTVPRRMDGGPIFRSPTGRPLTPGTLWFSWQKTRIAAGWPSMAFHELRHACATLLLERGATPEQVALQLGHTDGGHLVRTLYGHPDEDATRQRLMGLFGQVAPLRSITGARAPGGSA